MFIMKLYTNLISYISNQSIHFQQPNSLIAATESIASKYTVFNCVKFHYEHNIRNYFNFIIFIYAEIISR